MRFELTSSLAAPELATRIGARHVGLDIPVSSIAAIDDAVAGSLTYWQSDNPLPESLPSGTCVIIGESALAQVHRHDCCLVCRNPRLEFIRLLHWLGEEERIVSWPNGNIHPSAKVHSTAVIDSGASIGAGSLVGPRAHIASCCSLGENVTIGPGCIIGHPGFGYERDEEGVPIKFPHFGRVIIDIGCEVGSNTTIARGNLCDTWIGRHVKIDDQVYIAHNCVIGESTMIAGGARICGSVVIGSQCWIGSGAMIRQCLDVGNDSVIGLGAVVVQSVAAKTIVAGNPASVLDRESLGTDG
jgi:UDP-3-O-[3-hydroxymyristoyl] glucosamine N-acyltransferase